MWAKEKLVRGAANDVPFPAHGVADTNKEIKLAIQSLISNDSTSAATCEKDPSVNKSSNLVRPRT